MFVICNSSYFKTNFSAHSIHTRQKNNLHKPLVKFTSQQGGITYSAIKNLLRYLINFHGTLLNFNMTKYKTAFKKYLLLLFILLMNF